MTEPNNNDINANEQLAQNSYEQPLHNPHQEPYVPTQESYAQPTQPDQPIYGQPAYQIPDPNAQYGYATPAPAPNYAPAPGMGAPKSKVAAGVLGIVLGSLGIHKFYLGYTVPGLIMLLATVLTFGFAGIVTGIIGLVEGIIYLTMSDADFYRIYVAGKKEWF